MLDLVFDAVHHVVDAVHLVLKIRHAATHVAHHGDDIVENPAEKNRDPQHGNRKHDIENVFGVGDKVHSMYKSTNLRPGRSIETFF